MYNMLLSDLLDRHAICENHNYLEFFVNDIQHILNAFLASLMQSPCHRATQEHHVCPESQAFRNVSAPSDPSIDVYVDVRLDLSCSLTYALDNGHCRWQRVHAPAAIVRHPECIGTVVDCQGGLALVHDTFNYHWFSRAFLQRADILQLPEFRLFCIESEIED